MALHETLAVLAIAFCTSCLNTLRVIPFATAGEADAIVPLEAGRVAFYTDIQVNGGDGVAQYDIELRQGDRVVARTTCDPTVMGGRRACSYHLSRTDLSCSMSTGCEATLEAGGMTTVHARFSSGGLNIPRANLLIRQ